MAPTYSAYTLVIELSVACSEDWGRVVVGVGKGWRPLSTHQVLAISALVVPQVFIICFISVGKILELVTEIHCRAANGRTSLIIIVIETVSPRWRKTFTLCCWRLYLFKIHRPYGSIVLVTENVWDVLNTDVRFWESSFLWRYRSCGKIIFIVVHCSIVPLGGSSILRRNIHRVKRALLHALHNCIFWALVSLGRGRSCGNTILLSRFSLCALLTLVIWSDEKLSDVVR